MLPKRERRHIGAEVPKVVQQVRYLWISVLEPRWSARGRLEREEPIVVRLVGLERDVRVIRDQAVYHVSECLAIVVQVALARAVRPYEEVELEVADFPFFDRV